MTNQVVSLKEHIPHRSHAPSHKDCGHIVIEEVEISFGKGASASQAVKTTSLDIRPGEFVCILGPSGCGKSTLLNSIAGYVTPSNGTVSVDGRAVTGPGPDRGMVFQQYSLFPWKTIRDNIAYGNPTATEEQILEAARTTYVDRFVHSLPDGYDTLINEEADNISAGEKQLLTIARAFLADPAILILDEATSSVDTRTEVLIQQAMNALRAQRTSFVIAHRLSTIRGADVILVMEDGRIVEQGNHVELLERGGAYARLYNSQFTGALEEIE